MVDLALDSVRVTIYSADGSTFICNVPRRRGVTWQDELNAAGTGKFELHKNDKILTDHPDALNYYNIVKFYYRGVAIKAWQIEEKNPVYLASGEVADKWITVTGRGTLSLLETAILYPEYGIRQLTAEDRQFNFASVVGDWYNSSDWITPVGVLWTSSGQPASRTGYPKNWPDPNAYWIWSSNPNTSAPPGRNWFRSTFSLTANTNVILYATCDNNMVVYLDGVPVLANNPASTTIATRTTFTVSTTLAAGQHTIGAWVDNLSSGATSANPTGANPAAFLFSMYQADSSGNKTSTNLVRSSPSSFVVKPYGSTPGWSGANILRQAIEEARLRNVQSVQSITYNFTSSTDSAGVAWTDIQDRSFKIITTDLANLAQQIIELSLDVEIDANLVMNAWVTRGTDKSASVRLVPNRDLKTYTASQKGSQVRNDAILVSDFGYLEIYNSASKEDLGRREVGISAGNSNSQAQSTLIGKAALSEISRPTVTVPLSYTSAKGSQPYIDFNLGDTITFPDDNNILNPGRIMGITGAENEGYVQWDLDIYPITATETIDTLTVANGNTDGSPSMLYQSEVLSDSPWAYWRQQQTSDTTLFDMSGNRRNFQIIGSSSGYTLNFAGPVDKAVAWGTNTNVWARSSSTFAYQYATLEAWVYLIGYPSSSTSILGMSTDPDAGDSAQFDKVLYVSSDGKLNFYAYKDSTHNITAKTSSPLALNTWHHVAGTVGPAGTKLYLDRNLVVNNTTVTGSFRGAQYVFSRGGAAGVNGHGVMRIAEPAVYYQQLTASRVASHYDAASALL